MKTNKSGLCLILHVCKEVVQANLAVSGVCSAVIDYQRCIDTGRHLASRLNMKYVIFAS